MNGNTYEIKSLNDFRLVPDDRLNDCLVDFANAVRMTNLAEQTIQEEHPKAKAFLPAFTWIDDGKQGCRKLLINGTEVPLDSD